MPFDVERFNLAYLRAQDKIRHDPEAAVADVQGGLRALVPADASDARPDLDHGSDRGDLPDPPEPSAPLECSVLRGRPHQRRRLPVRWIRSRGRISSPRGSPSADLGDPRTSASKDEAPHIRAMTRTLEHLENDLRDPRLAARRLDRQRRLIDDWRRPGWSPATPPPSLEFARLYRLARTRFESRTSVDRWQLVNTAVRPADRHGVGRRCRQHRPQLNWRTGAAPPEHQQAARAASG